VGAWTSHIIEGILNKLAGLQKPMKYVCHVSLPQRAGAGLHAASCSRWNPKTDGKPGRELDFMFVSGACIGDWPQAVAYDCRHSLQGH
jgi:hypothetical protein